MAKKVSTGKKVTKKRVKKNVERGQAHIQSSFNNTIVTLTDAQGNAVVRRPRQTQEHARVRERLLQTRRNNNQ